MIRQCIDKFLPTREDRIKASQYAIRLNPENEPLGEFKNPLGLALETGKKWANGSTITCGFIGGSNIQRSKVEREAKKWEAFANIKFDFVGGTNTDIRIAFNKEDGSWSYMGTDCKLIPLAQPTMNFGWLYDSSPDLDYQEVVLHEFGHALGAIHEHQSPNANIPWDEKAVYSYYMGPPNNWTREDVFVNLLEKYSRTQMNSSEFDPLSIMMYSVNNALTIGDYAVGWNNDLSSMDKLWASQQYPKENQPIINPTLPTDLSNKGVVVSGYLKNGDIHNMKMNIGFFESGNYRFISTPSFSTLIAVSNGRNLRMGKGRLNLRLNRGTVTVGIRNDGPDGIVNISCKKV